MHSTAATDPDRLAEALDRRVRALTRLLRSGYPGGTSSTAASVLGRLRVDGAQRITELAAHERVAQPTITTLVRRLEGQGLVTRGGDAGDRRAVRVALTPEGDRHLDALVAERASALAARLRRLDPADLRALAAALPALDHILDATS